jgi:hypothetical protein
MTTNGSDLRKIRLRTDHTGTLATPTASRSMARRGPDPRTARRPQREARGPPRRSRERPARDVSSTSSHHPLVSGWTTTQRNTMSAKRYPAPQSPRDHRWPRSRTSRLLRSKAARAGSMPPQAAGQGDDDSGQHHLTDRARAVEPCRDGLPAPDQPRDRPRGRTVARPVSPGGQARPWSGGGRETEAGGQKETSDGRHRHRRR